MRIKNFVDMIRNVSGILNELETAGMRVKIGDDFSEYRSLRIAQTDRAELYPMFDVSKSYIDSSNGFWVCGFNEDGELIHTQAVRLLDLKDEFLGPHIDLHRQKYVTPNTTPDPDQTFYRGPEALDKVTGKVGYCGDFWLAARGLGGPRSMGTTPLLSRLLFELLERRWSPDFAFAFVPKQLAEKGAHLRYGYTHCEPGRWIGPDQQVTEEDYLIWMRSTDICNLLAREPQSLKKDSSISAILSTIAAIDASG